MRYFALVLVGVLAQYANGNEKELVSGDDIAKIKAAIFGTDFYFRVSQGKVDLRVNELLGGKWCSGWDKEVVDRATKWANTAKPNLIVEIEKKEGKWVVGNVRSAADLWHLGGTPMHGVAKEYVGAEVNTRNLNRLSADMRTAYHQHFKEEKKK